MIFLNKSNLEVFLRSSPRDMEHRTGLAFTDAEGQLSVPDGWVAKPDLSQVDGVPRKYWKLVGERPEPMSQPEQNAVDAAEVEARREALRAEIDESPLLVALARWTRHELNEIRRQTVVNLPPITLADMRRGIREQL